MLKGFSMDVPKEIEDAEFGLFYKVFEFQQKKTTLFKLIFCFQKRKTEVQVCIGKLIPV